jgi:hypothetical protein
MLDFTKIRFGGADCILVTEREHAREPILIIDAQDIDNLIEEWRKSKE